MKKNISLLICFILIIGINISACTTNTNIIQPDIPTPTNSIINNNDVINADFIALQSEIYALINEARINNNIGVLEYNNDLQKAANIRAKEISLQFLHTRPDNTNFTTAIGTNIEYRIVGENLLLIDKPVADAEVIVDTWMNSPDHKDNILMEMYKETAIGIYEYKDIIYISQLFIG